MSRVPYWGKYIEHDNNRDINYSAEANQNFLRWYLQWHPPIIHDLHESVPFLYIYSGQAPQNPLWSPILYSELPMLANWDMTQLARYGMPGVWTHAYVDAWSPGYVAEMATDHNGLMRFYEIMGNAGATTMERTITQKNPALLGGGGGFGDFTKREWYRPNPPYEHVLWSMRDNTNYAESGVLSSLAVRRGLSPGNRRRLLYQDLARRITAGTKEAPYGFILPSNQEDPTRVAFVMHILRMQGIEVGRAKAASQTERRHLSRRLPHRQNQSALWTAGEDSARQAGRSRSRAAHLRRQRLDHGPDDPHRNPADQRHRRAVRRRRSRGSVHAPGHRQRRCRRRRLRRAPITARPTWSPCATPSKTSP